MPAKTSTPKAARPALPTCVATGSEYGLRASRRSRRPAPRIEYYHDPNNTNNDRWHIHLSSSLGIGDISGLSGRVGDGPWRMRNQTYRHILNFNPGWIVGSTGFMNGVGGYGDMAGLWHYDCISVQTKVPANANGDPQRAPALTIHGPKTADNKPDVLDVIISNITLARMYGEGFRPTGEDYLITGRCNEKVRSNRICVPRKHRLCTTSLHARP
jgi:hypothetical protein